MSKKEKKKREKKHLDENERNQRTRRTAFRILPFIFLGLGVIALALMFFEVIPVEAGVAVYSGMFGVIDTAMFLIAFSELVWVFMNDGAWRKFFIFLTFAIFLGFTGYVAYLWNLFFDFVKNGTLVLAQPDAETSKQALMMQIGCSQLIRYLAFAGSVIICQTGNKSKE